MRHIGQTLIFAVAQRTFENNGNLFSTLVPLATLDGDEVDTLDFPNRGIAWWMVRGVPDVIRSRPGRLLIAMVEESREKNTSDPEKDLFQVNFDTVQVAGPKRLMEVVTPDSHASLEPSAIVNGMTALLDHEPTSLVLVRVGNRLYGPFKGEAEEDPQQKGQFRISFAKASGDRPIYEIERDAVPVLRRYAEVALDGNSPSRSAVIRRCCYEFILWNAYETACANAKTIRLSSDEEVVSRVAKIVMSRSKRQELLRQFKELTSGGSSADMDREDLARVEEIALGLNRSVDAVDGLVTAILDGGFLAGDVDKAVEAAAARAVGERASSIRAEAEQQIKDVRQALEERRKELAAIDADLERKRRAGAADIEAQLAAKKKAAEREIEEQLEAVARQKAELDRQRNAIEKNLTSVVRSFREEKDKLITDFLAISPILESVGVIRGGVAADEASKPAGEASSPAQPLTLPPLLALEHRKAAPVSEEEFFERFSRHVRDCGFSYRPIDLLSFHVSIKCSDLSVVGGVSGTGKSSLPRLYAQALAGEDHGQARRFLPVDVSPAWTNPSDLLGYVNLLDRSFHPGASGLFTQLAWAAMEAGAKGGDSGLYVICLDEMNLAHVEHYFSGFIQALSRAAGNREVTVFDPASVGNSDPARPWSRLPLGDNVRFVGTVNFDETTKPISQRVLDRADLLRLEPGPLLGGEGRASTAVASAAGEPITMTDVRSWIFDRPFEPAAAQVLEALQAPLKTLGCPLTPRRLSAIARFLGSAPHSFCTPEAALDLQVAQRILPQVKGLFRQEARQALGKVASILGQNDAAFEISLRIVREMLDSEDAMDPTAWGED
jgi:hypothetical protein